LAYVPDITATFGWVQEQYLMVETRGSIEGSGMNLWATKDYGVLYVPPAEDEGK
jgi:branched-subunit amino acid aminotransferase/4-amino-4-deoxychorismate lyase